MQEEFDLPELSEEIKQLTTEDPISSQDEAYRLIQKDAALAEYGREDPVSFYDPRPQGNVTPVRTQEYNTCWAFSSLGAGEQSLVAKGLSDPASLDLSEAHLAYFFYHAVEDPLGNTYGDGNENTSSLDFLSVGSNTIFSTFALAGWTGAAKEETMPFEDLDAQFVYEDSLAYEDAAHLQNAYWIDFKDVDAVNVVKHMVETYGACAINFYWGYRYYNSATSAYYFPLDPGRPNNHSVTIVGWDDSYPRENFNASCRPHTDGAWIVKNSYGEEWGDGGYFYLSYEDSAVNSANTSANRARAYVFDFEPADNYDYNYQYDGSAGAFNVTNQESELTKVDSGGSIANVFTVHNRGDSHRESLRAVSFALFDTAVSYSIQIYKNPLERDKPDSGIPQLSQPVTGSTSYAGYYTVPLPAAVTLKEGEMFSVVITLAKESGEPVDFFVDKTYQNGDWISFTNEVETGQSFRFVGGRWEDMASNGITARVKAFTDDAGIVLAKSIALDGVPKNAEGNYFLELWEDEAYQLSADVSPKDAVQKVRWESADTAVANVQTDGTVRPAGVGETTVRAAAADGSGVYAVCLVRVKARSDATAYEQNAPSGRERAEENKIQRQRDVLEPKRETAESVAAVGNVDTSDGAAAEILFYALLAAVCLCGALGKGRTNA